jgi:hypothetical protein
MDAVGETSFTLVTLWISGMNLRAVRRVRPNHLFHTYSFSLIALSFPSLSHSWSKVASADVWSLTRQCHGAPSSGAFSLWHVLTFLEYVLPCFHVVVDSISCRAAMMMDSSDGTAVVGVESASWPVVSGLGIKLTCWLQRCNRQLVFTYL